ncbi:4-(cytidine 5'-diphospho)-2-C-methyl-D-erythritol kinase [Fodinicurvata sp. CAU 1616]|uniref:4-diphosphocytidyl-2-C-methyl-D-erythritol kinase n=1 Tax=Aquibaculum arenosum TaxID=3032591 RepID=A0ABT5YL27_9PROT|nr:4-(cytidine 5'-diphospho)-2-C-methyl-D-erythritol kinase [Fodinicurvata sp. CAU 1616]
MTGAGAVVETAPAKLNLTLRVVGRRADGYHELESLVAFADCGDRLSAHPSGELTLEVTGPFAAALHDAGAGNLVLRAARLLAQAAGVGRGAVLTLDKRLPVAAGLGGGSADAAATLRLLQRLWSISLPEPGLQALAAELGADVPVCLLGRPALMRGVGERLEPLPALPPTWIVLANPGVALGTPEVFRARSGPFSAAAPLWATPPRTAAELAGCLRRSANDLEPAARALRPQIDVVLSALAREAGCLLARMSGSGASCFGLFATPEEAEAAVRRLKAAQPAWWVQATPLLTGA